MNPMKWLKDLRFQLFYGLVTRNDVPLVTLGNNCQWTIFEKNLGATSAILCAGAGNDISFEKALIKRHGCKVVLLDPSPTGIATVEKEALSKDRFTFMPVGLAGADGNISFEEPDDASEGSFRGTQTPPSGGLQLPCKSLSSLMSEQGWPRIDLLKIDIEGFEYEVIQDLLTNRLDVRQICVEYHHGRSFNRSRNDMIRSIFALRRAGYDLIHRIHFDHTFLRR